MKRRGEKKGEKRREGIKRDERRGKGRGEREGVKTREGEEKESKKEIEREKKGVVLGGVGEFPDTHFDPAETDRYLK